MRLENGLIAHATGGTFDGGDRVYKELRRLFADRVDTRGKLPEFLRRCSDLDQFWGWIKYEKGRYHERRQLVWTAFRPLIDYLEGQDRSLGIPPITETLGVFDAEHVQAARQKALDRRAADPEGATTAARTLLETVCKHILEDAGVAFPDDGWRPPEALGARGRTAQPRATAASGERV